MLTAILSASGRGRFLTKEGTVLKYSPDEPKCHSVTFPFDPKMSALPYAAGGQFPEVGRFLRYEGTVLTYSPDKPKCQAITFPFAPKMSALSYAAGGQFPRPSGTVPESPDERLNVMQLLSPLLPK